MTLLLALLCCLWAMPQQPAVMELSSNEFDTYLDLGVDFKEDLLNAGNAGEATLEFWVRSTKGGNRWTLTDMAADSEHFSLSMENDDQLTLKVGQQSTTVSLAGEVEAELWHHIALTISDNAGKVSLYVDGTKRTEQVMALDGLRDFHLYKDRDSEVLVTEIRGWAKARTPEQVADNQWRTLVSESTTQLNRLRDEQGLAVLYGNDDTRTDSLPSIPKLQQLGWKDLLSDSYSARATVTYDELTLVSVRTDVEHPILNLDQVLLTTTKGAVEDGVQLQWPHLKDVDGYNIYRDDQLIDNQTVQGVGVSDLITYQDGSVLPNALHAYRVVAYSNSDPNLSMEGSDRGFIFPNGQISGNLKTESEVFVEDAEVVATPAQPTGRTLRLASGQGAIAVNSVEVLRGLGALTLEFWYRGGSDPSGTPFQLGGLSMHFEDGRVKVSNGDSSPYLEAGAQCH